MSALYVEAIGQGPPVVLIPGLGYGSWCWDNQRSLADRFRLVLVDPPGSARSAACPVPDEIDEMSALISEAVLDVADPPINVVGHSMGGYLAMSWAFYRPATVCTLTLMSTSPGGPDAVPVPASTREYWLAHAGEAAPEYARATMPLSFAEGWTERHSDQFEAWLTRRLAFPTPPERWRAQFDAVEKFLDRGLDLREVSAPSLVIHGRIDRVVPFANGELLYERLQKAELLALDGVGHLPQLEASGAVNAAFADHWT